MGRFEREAFNAAMRSQRAFDRACLHSVTKNDIKRLLYWGYKLQDELGGQKPYPDDVIRLWKKNDLYNTTKFTDSDIKKMRKAVKKEFR